MKAGSAQLWAETRRERKRGSALRAVHGGKVRLLGEKPHECIPDLIGEHERRKASSSPALRDLPQNRPRAATGSSRSLKWRRSSEWRRGKSGASSVGPMVAGDMWCLDYSGWLEGAPPS